MVKANIQLAKYGTIVASKIVKIIMSYKPFKNRNPQVLHYIIIRQILGGEGRDLKVQCQLMNVEVLTLEIQFVTKIVKIGSCKNHQCTINYCRVGRDKRREILMNNICLFVWLGCLFIKCSSRRGRWIPQASTCITLRRTHITYKIL